jgi:hypothetical protein
VTHCRWNIAEVRLMLKCLRTAAFMRDHAPSMRQGVFPEMSVKLACVKDSETHSLCVALAKEIHEVMGEHNRHALRPFASVALKLAEMHKEALRSSQRYIYHSFDMDAFLDESAGASSPQAGVVPAPAPAGGAQADTPAGLAKPPKGHSDAAPDQTTREPPWTAVEMRLMLDRLGSDEFMDNHSLPPHAFPDGSARDLCDSDSKTLCAELARELAVLGYSERPAASVAAQLVKMREHVLRNQQGPIFDQFNLEAFMANTAGGRGQEEGDGAAVEAVGPAVIAAAAAATAATAAAAAAKRQKRMSEAPPHKSSVSGSSVQAPTTAPSAPSAPSVAGAVSSSSAVSTPEVVTAGLPGDVVLPGAVNSSDKQQPALFAAADMFERRLSGLGGLSFSFPSEGNRPSPTPAGGGALTAGSAAVPKDQSLSAPGTAARDAPKAGRPPVKRAKPAKKSKANTAGAGGAKDGEAGGRAQGGAASAGGREEGEPAAAGAEANDESGSQLGGASGVVNAPPSCDGPHPVRESESRSLRFQPRILNPYLVCTLCNGYYNEATTVIECFHTFCRTCIVKHLRNSAVCPECGCELGAHPKELLKTDRTLQAIVNKVFPHLDVPVRSSASAAAARKGIKKLAVPHGGGRGGRGAAGRGGRGSAGRAQGRGGRGVSLAGSATANGQAAPPPINGSAAVSGGGGDGGSAAIPAPEISFSLHDPSGATRPLDKPFLRTSIRMTVAHLRKHLSRKVLRPDGSQFACLAGTEGGGALGRIEIFCREVEMAAELSLDEIAREYWREPEADLVLEYKLVEPGEAGR